MTGQTLVTGQGTLIIRPEIAQKKRLTEQGMFGGYVHQENKTHGDFVLQTQAAAMEQILLMNYKV